MSEEDEANIEEEFQKKVIIAREKLGKVCLKESLLGNRSATIRSKKVEVSLLDNVRTHMNIEAAEVPNEGENSDTEKKAKVEE